MIDIEKVKEALDLAINWKAMTGQPMADEIIEALTELERLQKKEVPMKVNGDENDWGCKNCDSTIEHQYPRCPNCGQKLDWSE